MRNWIKSEMKSPETRESRKADNFHTGLQSQRWAVLKRTWETQDWLTQQTNKPLDWSVELKWLAWNGETFQIRKRVVGADLHNTERELEVWGVSRGRGSDEKTHRGMRGAKDQGVCLGVDSMETNRLQLSSHRQRAVFPRKEKLGMLNTEKHTDKYTLPYLYTLTERHCFRMRSINLWLDPGSCGECGCMCGIDSISL